MYRFFYPYTLALLGMFVCFPLFLTAQRNNFRITPAPQWLAPYTPDLHKTPDLREVSSGYYLRLFEEQHHADLKSTYRHFIRQIVSEAGVQNGAEINIDYDPAYEQLKFHQLLIRRNGTVIHKLNAGKFKFLQQEKELSRFIYSGVYTAYFIIDDVRKGDQIEYAYTLEGHNPIFEDKYFDSFYFTAYEPIVNYYKNLIAQPSRNIQFRSFNQAPLPTKKNWQGMNLYEWKLVNVTEPEDANYNTPSWYNSYAFIQASEYTRWEDIVNWALQVNNVNGVTPALQARIAGWQKETGSNKMAYMQKAVRFVQDDIRYMGIEMGEYSHRPSQPEKILTQRFGDCKDKSLLLCTLLQAAGIEASIAYVDTYSKGKIADYLPSPVLFNHTIVYATAEGKSYWIDPTINYQRGPVSSITIPDYQKALVIKKGTGALSDVINPSKGTIQITESFILPESNTRPAQLQVTSNYTLQFADDQRALFAESSMKEQERTYLDYYKKIYGDVTADTTLQVTDTDNPDLFEITEKYTFRKPWQADSTTTNRQQFHVQARILTDLLPRMEEEDSLNKPLALKYPYSLDYTLNLQMPGDWAFEDEGLHIKNKYYRIDFTSSVHGRNVKLHYQYETYQDHVPVQDMPAYRADRRKLSENAGFYLYWDPTATTNTNSKKPGNGVSWVMVVLCALFVGIFSYIAVRFYKRSVFPLQYAPESWPIGGWLMLLGFGIIFTPFNLLVSIITDGFFSNSTWEAVIHAQDGQVRLLVLIGELAGNSYLWVCSVLLLILFVRRRDTFPAVAIIFYLSLFSILVLDRVALGLLNKHFTWSKDEITAITRAGLAAAIWIPYLIRSERVKKTFVVPHPSAVEGRE